MNHNGIKYTYEEVVKIFGQNQCVLISKEYHNAHQYLVFICKCGNKSKKKFYWFLKKPFCRTCGYAKRNQFGPNNPHWNPDRDKVEMASKFRTICKNLLRRSMKAISNKDDTTYKILGYTNIELINYITNHPNWNKCSIDSWSIDHIFPIKAFIDFGITDIRIINHLSNLQPMSRRQNCSKKDSYCVEAFTQYLKERGIN